MYINPYENAADSLKNGMKANLHTHAGTGKNTCGYYEIDEVIAAYKDAGYKVLTISNHDLFSDVNEFERKYDIVLLNGYEYSSDPHMLCVDVRNVLLGTHQEAINNCIEQGGFSILCHPNWERKEYWVWKDIDALRGYIGIEIFNGVIFRLNGSGLATDTWDYLLSQGKLVWGFGNDDFHRWHDMAKAWNIIYSPSPAHVDVKESILKGCFCTSTGLRLDEFDFESGALKVSASSNETYVKVNKYTFIGKGGEVLSEQFGEYGIYNFTGNELYVRVQVVSEHGAMLWTQPIYKKNFRKT
jgi:hypothetical protein